MGINLLNPGDALLSPGCSQNYLVVGPVCRLYDREELPWPCCRIQWHGKEPSWRRIGTRFVPDMSYTKRPSYSVIWFELGTRMWCHKVITLTWVDLAAEEKEWWYSRKLKMNSSEQELIAC